MTPEGNSPLPWTVLTLYRIIAVFLTLVFRGSCNSSPLSGHTCVCPASRPREELAASPVLLSISFHHKSLGAQFCLESPPRSVDALARGCSRRRPTRPHRRHHPPRQPTHTCRDGQGPHLHPSRRRLRHRRHRTRLQRPLEYRLLSGPPLSARTHRQRRAPSH